MCFISVFEFMFVFVCKRNHFIQMYLTNFHTHQMCVYLCVCMCIYAVGDGKYNVFMFFCISMYVIVWLAFFTLACPAIWYFVCTPCHLFM